MKAETMERTGYVLMWRKWLDSEMVGDPNAVYVFMWCLCKATYKPRTYRGLDLEPGQFVTGTTHGAAELQLARSTFYKTLKRLEKLKQIELSGKRQGTVVTICNWTTYQDPSSYPGNEKETQRKRKGNDGETQRKPNKNVIKEEGKKEEELFLSELAKTACAKIRKLSAERKRKLRSRLDDPEWVAAYPEAFVKLKKPWVTEGWFPDFDWIVKNETNIFSLIEGKFDFRNVPPNGNGKPAERPKKPIGTSTIEDWES